MLSDKKVTCSETGSTVFWNKLYRALGQVEACFREMIRRGASAQLLELDRTERTFVDFSF